MITKKPPRFLPTFSVVHQRSFRLAAAAKKPRLIPIMTPFSHAPAWPRASGLHLLRGAAVRGGQTPRDRDASDSDGTVDQPWLLCVACHHRICQPSQRIVRGGGHEHTFFNPHGVVFHLGCFGLAPGCISAGPPSAEFSWFAGYRWLFAFCARCRNHLGWRFQDGPDGPFFGLILNRITASDQGRGRAE